MRQFVLVAVGHHNFWFQSIAYAFATSIFFFLYGSAFRFGLFLIMRPESSAWHMHPSHVLKWALCQARFIFRVLYAIGFTSGSMGFASAYFPEYLKVRSIQNIVIAGSVQAKFAAGLIFKMIGDEPRIDGMSKGGQKPVVDL